MQAKYVVCAASAASGIVIVACLAMVVVLCHDISALYNDVMDDMVEFKTLANDAWREMVAITQGPGVTSRATSRSSYFNSQFRFFTSRPGRLIMTRKLTMESAATNCTIVCILESRAYYEDIKNPKG